MNTDNIPGIRLDVASVRPRTRRRGAWSGSVAVVAVIALQVAVPMAALLRPPPQKFGFQMYSGLGGVTVSVVDGDGDAEKLNDVEQIVGKLRPEIDWLQLLPESVCTAIPRRTCGAGRAGWP